MEAKTWKIITIVPIILLVLLIVLTFFLGLYMEGLASTL